MLVPCCRPRSILCLSSLLRCRVKTKQTAGRPLWATALVVLIQPRQLALYPHFHFSLQPQHRLGPLLLHAALIAIFVMAWIDACSAHSVVPICVLPAWKVTLTLRRPAALPVERGLPCFCPKYATMPPQAPVLQPNLGPYLIRPLPGLQTQTDATSGHGVLGFGATTGFCSGSTPYNERAPHNSVHQSTDSGLESSGTGDGMQQKNSSYEARLRHNRMTQNSDDGLVSVELGADVDQTNKK